MQQVFHQSAFSYVIGYALSLWMLLDTNCFETACIVSRYLLSKTLCCKYLVHQMCAINVG
jgi:hypothetical protein